MSHVISPRPRSVGVVKRHFPIVASQFNQAYVQGLVDHFTTELRNLAPAATLTLHQVPGAFEVPVIVRELASQRRGDAIIAIGVILKGKTDHAEHLARSVTDALQRIAVSYGTPVLNVVLSFDNETQARERCLEDEINRGTEAARAAIEITNLMSKLRSK